MKIKDKPFLFFALIMSIALIIFLLDNRMSVNDQLPYYGNGKVAKNKKERIQKQIRPVPPFSFINQYGKKTDESFIKGKVCVASIFFTNCPGICPRMSTSLSSVQDVFRNNKNVKILSVTCDPERDGITELHNYANVYSVNGFQWQFVTGNKKELYRFARKGLQVVTTDGDGGPDDFIHSQNLVLIDQEGYIRGYYDGTNEEEAKELIKDIFKLL
jgi:protein SCO1